MIRSAFHSWFWGTCHKWVTCIWFLCSSEFCKILSNLFRNIMIKQDLSDGWSIGAAIYNKANKVVFASREFSDQLGEQSPLHAKLVHEGEFVAAIFYFLFFIFFFFFWGGGVMVRLICKYLYKNARFGNHSKLARRLIVSFGCNRSIELRYKPYCLLYQADEYQ